MRVLCVCYEYPPIGGGGATVCQGMSESFVQAGHQVDIVTSGMKDLPAYEQRNGVGIYRVPCKRRHRHYTTTLELITGILPAYRKARQLIQSHSYDLNHCHFVVPSGLVSYLLFKRTGLPYVLTAHGSDIPGYNPDRFEWAHKLIRPLWSKIIQSSSMVTAPSCYLEQLIQSHIDIPVEVIPNGFDPPHVQSVQRKNRVLVVTRMFERKGVQYLIKAIEKLGTDWEFWVVGDGPYLPTLKNLAQQMGVSVQFLGFIPRHKLAEIYRSAKVFVFPSSRENFPVVLLEAMAAGCAVITTSASGCAEVVEDAAIQVEPHSAKAIREALIRLMNDEGEIVRLGDMAKKRIARFAWPKIAQEFESVFQRYVTMGG